MASYKNARGLHAVEAVLDRLPDARESGSGWSARCPAHDDRRKSLSIGVGDDGRALMHCHAGCSVEAIVESLGLNMGDLMASDEGRVNANYQRNRKAIDTPMKRPANPFPSAEAAVGELERRHGRSSAIWSYQDSDGEPVGIVLRWDRDGKKDIRPVGKQGAGWIIGGMAEPRPLYRLPELAAAPRVYLVEGEKAADAARSIGLVATTSAHGANSAGKTDWSPLAGKEVVILPDNDPPGRKYAETAMGIMAGLEPAPVVRLVELPGVPEGGDLVDWICGHGDAAEPDDLREQLERLVESAETPTASGPLEYLPFPVDTLPEPVRSLVTAGAKAIGCDPSYLALPLLTVLAAAIGNTRRIQLKRGWHAPPILWTAIVGESGNSKTPAFKLVMKPARERQRKALERHAEAMKTHEADLAWHEKMFSQWKRDKTAADPPAKPDAPEAERCIVSDVTVESLAPLLLANPRGLLLARDELAGWIGSFDRYAGGKGGADAAHWLSMHNAEGIVVDRKTGIPRTIFVPAAAMCLTGGIQPGILRRALGTEHRESGLAARLLLACPPRHAKRWTEADVDPQLEAQIACLLDRLFELEPGVGDDGEPHPELVTLAPAAKAAWTTFYNRHAQEQSQLSGDLAAAWSKLEEYAARLALVIHLSRWGADDPTLQSQDVVDEWSMASGIQLTEWFKHECRRVYDLLRETGEDREQCRLTNWIKRKGGRVAPRDVQRGCSWLKGAGAAEAALEELVKSGKGRWLNQGPSANGGRPSRIFDLST